MFHSKKILIISPVPTHPDFAGNRKGVLNVVNFFKKNGADVSFFYLEMEDYSFKEMNNYFSQNLFVIKKKEVYNNQFDLKKDLISQSRKILNYIKSLFGFISFNEFRYNSNVDFLINKKIIKKIKEIAEQKWDVVVCEYVWLSKLLTMFPNSVLKILDTHDRFSNRFQRYLEMKSNPQWVSLFESEELRGLKRADIIISLNKTDELYFKKNTNKQIARFHYLPELNPIPSKIFSYTLLYFASSNLNNLQSINYFIDNIFPELQKKFKNVKLLIGGTITNSINVNSSNIFVKGGFEDPIDFYQLGDIVINPEISGTGFKIKSFEALSFGLPLISNVAGALGIIDDLDDCQCPILLAESINDYIMHIFTLSDSIKYNQIVSDGMSFVEKLKKNSFNSLLTSINKFIPVD